MYLKSLILKGFKSFADRSVLSLEPGITAVVGPNGSGKSNISDAVLWVLGERNAKNLRGQAMEDVIFAGSSARKSVGLAEVDLVLDNSDGTLPVEFSEVAITRRMYRSGESEYLINGTPARRMDVLDILHDSGLGTGTHSIISQGNLDSILQSKPEDRRALIEEAAGVLKHKQRKAKSARKLERMDQHLARVKDVAAEVERQLGPLARKAKRARAYQELSAQLSDLTISLAVDELRGLQRSWDASAEKERALAAELEQRKEAIQEAEQAVEQLQERIRRQSVDAGELSRLHRRASAAVERFDAATLLLHEKRRAAQGYAADLQVSMESDKARRAQAAVDRAEAASQLSRVKEQKAVADAKVAQLTEEHAALTRRHREADGEIAALEKGRRGDEAARAQASRDLERTREELASGMAHAKLVEARRAELDAQLSRAATEAEQKAAAASEAAEGLSRLEAAEKEARAAAGAAFQEREAARGALDAARDAASSLASQIKGLEEAARSAVAAGPARSWLLDNAEDVPGALAPLSAVLRAEEGMEALVERLLSDDVSALLSDGASCAAGVAGSLEAAQVDGEVVLVPRAARTAGALGRDAAQACGGRALVDALTYPDEAARAVEALLGDVVVCGSLEAALRAWEADAYGARFATPDGALVWPSGKVALGGAAEADAGAGVLARERHLDELRARLGEAERERAAAEEASRAAEATLNEVQAASLRISQDLARARGMAEAARKEADEAQRRLASLRAECEEVERQRAEAARAVDAARPSVEALEQRIEELARRVQEAEARLSELREGLAPLRKQAAQARDALAEAKLAAATLLERLTYTERIVDARDRELSQLDAAAAEARETLARKTAAQRRAVPLLALMEELSDSARRRARALEERANEAQDSSSGLHAQANEARARARAAHDAFDEANARMGQVKVDKGRLEVQVEAAVNAIVHDCGVPLERALELPELEDRAAVEGEAFKLRRRIANMGTINPDAAQEYEQLKGRYDYLAAQLDDLDGARRALAKIVRVIDARMKDDFIRTFQTVNENFREIFSTLFPGGSAELSLVDPDDLENSGVEVHAQPRGKRITKMMLMSGGEKSLTALALLFAVYRTRATPFYILDEVEAALDDSNLRRLTAYLNSLRDTTQLIMITHQRRTMEMADVLFGVSMQADGVTKVVSQRLENALQHAE
ncbi:MAG TPA: chromosome segregation protein SMC [Candidatus Aphodovivens avistercoris]|nr:chromosome segregation protein SMC [Candidatus Aphodovivens avistercoris]